MVKKMDQSVDQDFPCHDDVDFTSHGSISDLFKSTKMALTYIQNFQKEIVVHEESGFYILTHQQIFIKHKQM